MSDEFISALRRIYGDDPQTIAEQSKRYERGLSAFKERYGSGEVIIYRAPGRVNLIGEHTDYNHGFVLPMALDKDILLFARPRADQTVNLSNTESEFTDRRFTISRDIPLQPTGDWANYAQGPAQLLEREHGPGLRGYDALVEGDPPHGVPRGAGLSSSSALTVACALAIVGVNNIDLRDAPLADACGRAEWYVGTRGGIMDHFSSVLGKRDHALFLDCRPIDDAPTYSYRHVPIPPGYSVVVVDSRMKHKNTGPLFNRRVAADRIGVRLLQSKYPDITHLRDVDEVPWDEIEPLLPQEIHRDTLKEMGINPDTILDNGVSAETDTFYVRQRCRHVVTENHRVIQSITALQASDLGEFGRLLKEAHASARNDYEISTPEIETLVKLANGVPGTAGARLTGAGWGGCIVAIVAHESEKLFRETVIRGYLEETGIEAQVFVCHSAAGAGEALRTS